MIPWRIIRLVWISVTNGLLLYLALPQLIREVRAGHAFDLSFCHTVATIVLMASGIVLEALRIRIARYINVGYYLAMAVWLSFLIVAASLGKFGVEVEAGIASILYGVAFLAVFLINAFLYRAKLTPIEYR